ncbi:hypothetical protein FS837_010528 [Tulasnella sp. UAMH 9824]|nr:hypothetical protein FS837_010528 [Tulasnella sp. UAMH 9824]
MSHSLMDFFAPSDSTRMSSNSPSWSSSSFTSTSTVPDTTAPFTLYNNFYHNNASWTISKSNNGGVVYTGGLCGPSPAATQTAAEATARQPPTPPTVQLHKLSLSSPLPYAPCGPVTFVPTLGFLAPRPVMSGRSFIGPPSLGQPQPPPDIPPRPHMRPKIPPEKGRKPFDCLQPGCGMKFPKRNALAQHMRSHTGERPEVCEYCKRAFSLKCNLRRHYKTCKKKKAMDKLLAGIKQDPPSSPGSFGESPTLSASSPLSTAAVAPSLDSPPGDVFAAPPFLWDPGFGTTCENLSPTQLAYLTPCPPLVRAQF